MTTHVTLRLEGTLEVIYLILFYGRRSGFSPRTFKGLAQGNYIVQLHKNPLDCEEQPTLYTFFPAPSLFSLF